MALSCAAKARSWPTRKLFISASKRLILSSAMCEPGSDTKLLRGGVEDDEDLELLRVAELHDCFPPAEGAIRFIEFQPDSVERKCSSGITVSCGRIWPIVISPST
ncbi:hypothetical protein Droror1_Dr00016014 [Drosera rotundifolia]